MTTANLRSSTDYIPLVCARSALARSRITAMRDITVESNSEGIEIRGRVSLFYYKQLALELVRKEIGSTPLFDRVEVVQLD